MITLIALITLVWFPISWWRIHKECKRRGIEFHFMEAGFVNYSGFAIGIIISIMTIIYVCIKYLP